VVKQESDSLKDSQRIWSGIYCREISVEETREIIGNLSGCFDILYKWSLQENNEKK